MAKLNVGPYVASLKTSPAQVRDLLTLLSVDVPWFTVDAPAEEWHLSENSRHQNVPTSCGVQAIADVAWISSVISATRRSSSWTTVT